ncbi:hypothetical protein CTheo_5491 [Ceratobasidium theobromae]|uniref:Uncharacterized protein n=1 Tax=Ceratobasidium theobromae TaxID=1582974 RepID=A0A5N5QHH4_9AGAM|nr:hypothetical protein CTheo_5491 [Ceratobasidium theobromae]
MRVLASTEVQKASLPPHSQASTPPSPLPSYKEKVAIAQLQADMSLSPTAFTEFCTQIPMAIAMERHAEIYDVSVGADVTRYFDGTVELDASANPSALRYLYAFEVKVEWTEVDRLTSETAHTASGIMNDYILFEKPYVVPHTAVYRCRFRLAVRSFHFPRHGQTGFFQVRVAALFALPDPASPGGTRMIRAPTMVHRFSLQVKVSPGSILNAVR